MQPPSLFPPSPLFLSFLLSLLFICLIWLLFFISLLLLLFLSPRAVLGAINKKWERVREDEPANTRFTFLNGRGERDWKPFQDQWGAHYRVSMTSSPSIHSSLCCMRNPTQAAVRPEEQPCNSYVHIDQAKSLYALTAASETMSLSVQPPWAFSWPLLCPVLFLEHLKQKDHILCHSLNLKNRYYTCLQRSVH